MCVLNWGGIRRSFTAGDLTVKNVFELMPFENEVVVVTLSGEKVLEMVRFMSNAEFGHPLSGIQFVSNDENSIFDVHSFPRLIFFIYIRKKRINFFL